jgi:purine catabolism regulator
LYEKYNASMKSLTIGDLLRGSALDLRLVSGGRGLSNRIRWAHVSELGDPTPWLKGGELLLTTGMGVGATPARQRAYIHRLTRAGLAGLGFGTGFSHGRVPRPLARAAEEAAFPLFEVPYEVPFIAITEAVFTRVAAEQYDVLSRSLEAEHVLTREVLGGGGIEGMLRALTKATRGWVVVLDPHGMLIAADPRSAAARVPALAAELRSPPAEAARFGVALIDRGEHVSIQPVAAQGRVEAFLAVGKGEALTQFDRIVSGHALSLLALELDKARAVAEAERRLKGDLLDQMLRGAVTPEEARYSLERLGFDPGGSVQAVVLMGDGSPEALALACEELMTRRPEPFFCSPHGDVALVVLQGQADGFLPTLREAVADRSSGQVLAGASRPVPIEQLAQGVREARYALLVCRSEGREAASFADLGTFQLLLTLQEPEALRAFAASVLGSLDRYDDAHGGELLSSLRAFLDHNARWEAAARRLYVHRHTLRYRMRRVEELTGRRLSSARDRMEFFLALRAREMLASGDASSGGNGSPARQRRRRSRGRTTARSPA